jgi:hypothetical protein
MTAPADQTPQDDLEARIFTSITGPAAGPSGSQDEPGQENPKLTNAQILAGALGAGRDVFCLVTDFKTPKATLSDENCTTLGDAWGKVCDKRGWNLNGYLGDYALEIAAALATVAIAKAVADGVKAEIAQREPVDVSSSEPDAPPAADAFNG